MTTTITVHGFHLDGYGHVNNARYLEFLEAARWDQLHAHQDLQWWHQRGYAFVIANININFRRAASLGDTLLFESVRLAHGYAVTSSRCSVLRMV